jgi:hypothetical protein
MAAAIDLYESIDDLLRQLLTHLQMYLSDCTDINWQFCTSTFIFPTKYFLAVDIIFDRGRDVRHQNNMRK